MLLVLEQTALIQTAAVALLETERVVSSHVVVVAATVAASFLAVQAIVAAVK